MHQAFGPYDLVQSISVGGTGEVFRAIIRSSGRVVAVKRLMPAVCADDDVIAAVHDEAVLSRALDHPAITKVLDEGNVGGIHFITYEFVDGRDLRTILNRAAMAAGGPNSPPSSRRPGLIAPSAPIPRDVALAVVMRVCEALDHAHARLDAQGRPLGLVHRDVSPSNILVSFEGAVKLSDFGIARALGRVAHTAVGEVKGTIGYMSPEQVNGQPVDGRSDLFSLGVCLWELVTGRRLFEGFHAVEVMQRIASGNLPAPRTLNAELPHELERIILKALAQSRDRRYPTGHDFHADLFRLAQSEGQLADPACIARYVRNLFPVAAADGAAPSEESRKMGENKGGSDLDVFEGLAKKSPRSQAPGLTPPPASVPRQRTLVGGLGPLPPPPPLNAPNASPSGLPPPSLAKPLPPPSGLPAPLPSASRGTLPPVSAPPQRISNVSGATPIPPLPPPTITPMRPPAATSPGVLPPPLAPPGPSAGAAAPGEKAKRRAAKGAAVDMDWDDEEESTHVYDKQTQDIVQRSMPRPAAGAPATQPPKVGAAAALVASSGGTAAKSMPPSVIVPSGPPAGGPLYNTPQQYGIPAQAIPAPPRYGADEPTYIRPRPERGGSKVGAILGALSLVAVVGLAAFIFFPRSGQFKVDIKAKDGSAIPKAEIFVDGVKKCDTAPCVVTDLGPGPKTIKVVGPGFSTSVTEAIEGGKEKLVFLTVETSGSGNVDSASNPAPSEKATGIKATTTQVGIKVLVDGEPKGTLPIELKLPAGPHKVRFEGGERYQTLDQSVDVAANEMKELGPIKLKVLKGQVTLDLVTSGAAVSLLSQGAKRVEKKLPEALWKTPPVKLDIDGAESWKLVATKKGFQEFSQELGFDDGQAEKTIRIELTEVGKRADTGTTPLPLPAGTGVKANDAPPPATPPPADGNGTININSIPVSKVLLDGKPLGSTPKVGVSVPAGSHTITFVHPEKGRKSVSVTVKAGETKTAAVKF